MTRKYYMYQEMWQWIDNDDNRRRIRFDTLSKVWQWVDKTGSYHNAEDNTFSGAVCDAFWAETYK